MADRTPPSAGASPEASAPSDSPRPPSVDRVLREPCLAAFAAAHGHEPAARGAREALDEAREAIREGRSMPPVDAIAARALERAAASLATRLVPVVNLTGTVIHTNLGRALVAEEAIDAAADAMRGYVALEYDLGGGDRGDRDHVVEGLLRELTGAEAATVVNNNAAAVVLSLAALAARREAVISHGELIEIGGAFRMPDIMRTAGCKLVAVGTTNRTHAKDYEAAIGPKTGVVVKAHWSNYAITGFTKVVPEAEIAAIAHGKGVPLLVDLGAGALVDLSRFGVPREPLPSESLAAGADVVTFSGDKLLGGPQAGLIVGTRAAIARIKKHPLKRALRCSKITLAVLEATLRIYASGHRLPERLPVLAMLARPAGDIRAACERMKPALERFAGPGFTVTIADCASQIGSGSLPVERLASAALVARPARGARGGAAALAAKLRSLPVPVIGRVNEGALWLDLRCLREREEAILAAQFGGAAP